MGLNLVCLYKFDPIPIVCVSSECIFKIQVCLYIHQIKALKPVMIAVWKPLSVHPLHSHLEKKNIAR